MIDNPLGTKSEVGKTPFQPDITDSKSIMNTIMIIIKNNKGIRAFWQNKK